ncbi:type II toxin-antitoxin system RelE/ParE family toxin [Piscinibacter sp.]|uniref:type II toxin-antitoxin system RelE/ParE family toxin n=1 Tax=Piscinibacter sp. TaxID=1903157 RepID=UPI002CCC0EEC|nr:type II toxin-antitoxin system RelE/ParE family toxin [Albitalea sp.]HUG24070.1 type II toxin-antitoxin system RelE/ParE family toxin [Albitalea sp.]
MPGLVFTPQAFDDLRTARLWYEERRPGLGAAFESAVEALLDRALRMPDSFPEAAYGVRRAAVRRYPYDVYYRVRERQLVVVLVFHTARDPGLAMTRLQQH